MYNNEPNEASAIDPNLEKEIRSALHKHQEELEYPHTVAGGNFYAEKWKMMHSINPVTVIRKDSVYMIGNIGSA